VAFAEWVLGHFLKQYTRLFRHLVFLFCDFSDFEHGGNKLVWNIVTVYQ
jgi:hypothetical protein